jgi:hypothetical protein
VRQLVTSLLCAQVKATSNAFKNNISSQKGGEHLVMLAGWRAKVATHRYAAIA